MEAFSGRENMYLFIAFIVLTQQELRAAEIASGRQRISHTVVCKDCVCDEC